jgi:phytoene dehydrogenase-like protein
MPRAADCYDAVIVGAGHNGLVAATLLAQSGARVAVVERLDEVGGAAVSANLPGTGVSLSRYAYLVSLFPRWLLDQLGIGLELRRRAVSSYTPVGDGGILDRTGIGLSRFDDLADRLSPGFGGPLPSAADIRRLLGSETFAALCERPLSELIEASFSDDVTRGIVATDALIGTFAPLDDPQLRQNRCYLYHVVGGPWDVPVGGMGALTGALGAAAAAAGADVATATAVTAIDADTPGPAVVRLADGRELRTHHVLANVAPRVLQDLLGDRGDPGPGPEGSQLKLNLVLERLPRLRDRDVDPREAFAGTFHVNESYSQLNAAYERAAGGELPDPVPCEAYCHSLTDPSILGSALAGRGAATLTVFALHMPTRLFRGAGPGGRPIDHAEAKARAVAATFASINSVLAEPLESCLMRDPNHGRLCLEAHTPVELEAELGLPGGHIFHGDLTWPWAQNAEEVGRWGVETDRPHVWICGSGARRGGAVSGLPGHNAAMAVLEQLGRSAQ